MSKSNNQSLMISVLALSIAVWLWSPGASAQAVPEPETDRWNFLIAPYLWATAIDGTVGIGGTEVDVDASFSDLLEVVDVALAAHFEAQKGQWGFFADAFYSELEDNTPTPVGNVKVENQMRILEAGGIYEFNPTFQGLLGVRSQGLDVDINVPGLPQVSGDQDWVDGFVGVRILPVRTEKWFVSLRGDVGAGDSDSVLNGVVSAGYRFNKTWSLIGAYRILSTDLTQDNFKWDVTMSGLGVALGISW